ncbi:hypothetical protein CARUB_v10007394mg, partial [Capsella rubella]
FQDGFLHQVECYAGRAERSFWYPALPLSQHVIVVHSQMSLNIAGSKHTIDVFRDNNNVDADTPYAELLGHEDVYAATSFTCVKSYPFQTSNGQAMKACELIIVKLDDPSAVRKVEPFSRIFPRLVIPAAVYGTVDQRCAAICNTTHMILSGYEHYIYERNPETPIFQWQEFFAVLKTGLPKYLRNTVGTRIKQCSGEELLLRNLKHPLFINYILATNNDGFMLHQRLDNQLSHKLFNMVFLLKCVLRFLMNTIEELKLNPHNDAMKPDHITYCQYEETTVEMILEEKTRERHKSIGVRVQ